MSGAGTLEGRCAVVFLGLPHHVRRLRPVLAALESRGMELRYLTARNVPSLGEGNNACFEPGLEALGIRWRHLYDYRTEGHAEALVGRLGELANGLEEADDEEILDLFVGIDRGWFSLAVEDVVECDLLMARVIERERPDLVLGLHEANFWVKLLARRAALAGVPALTFQEGHYDSSESDRRKYTVMAEFSTVAVWGETAREAVSRQSPQALEKLVPVGDAVVEEILDPTSDRAVDMALEARRRCGLTSDERVVTLLLPNPYEKYTEAIPIREIATYLASLGGVRLVTKWHPRESFATIVRFRDLEVRGELLRVLGGDVRDWLLASDLCMVLDSTAGLDALVLGKPLIEINFAGRSFGRSYADAGVAGAIRGTDDLWIIEEILAGRMSSWTEAKRREYLSRIYAAVDGDAIERVVALAERLIGGEGEDTKG